MVTGLNFVLVHVRDVARARAFYTEKLGLTVADESPDFVQFAQPGGQGATFALSLDPAAKPTKDPQLWWYVEDADAAHAELVRKGVEITSPLVDMPFGRTFAINDSEGNTLYLLKLR